MRAPTGTAGQAVREERQAETHNEWAYAPLDDVKANMKSVGYEEPAVQFHVGKVEDTLRERIPETIAFLRLDTDWYESTKMEMDVLFPRLQTGGILLIDDYGSWQGARLAVDEYIKEKNIKIFLSRPDAGGRIAVKP